MDILFLDAQTLFGFQRITSFSGRIEDLAADLLDWIKEKKLKGWMMWYADIFRSSPDDDSLVYEHVASVRIKGDAIYLIPATEKSKANVDPMNRPWWTMIGFLRRFYY